MAAVGLALQSMRGRREAMPKNFALFRRIRCSRYWAEFERRIEGRDEGAKIRKYRESTFSAHSGELGTNKNRQTLLNVRVNKMLEAKNDLCLFFIAMIRVVNDRKQLRSRRIWFIDILMTLKKEKTTPYDQKRPNWWTNKDNNNTKETRKWHQRNLLKYCSLKQIRKGATFLHRTV